MKTKAYYDSLDMHIRSTYLSVWIDELWYTGELLEFVFIGSVRGLGPNLYKKAHNLLDEGI